jgi:hypothetical protein
MKIHQLLLHTSTTVRCGTATIGDLVAATGKEQLWSERKKTSVDVIVIHYISAALRHPDAPFSFENVMPLFP